MKTSLGGEPSSSTQDLTSAIQELIQGLKAEHQSSRQIHPNYHAEQGVYRAGHLFTGHIAGNQPMFHQGSFLFGPDSVIRTRFDADPAVFGCSYDLLEAHRSDVASLARFSQRVEHATFHLIVVVDAANFRAEMFVDRLLTEVSETPRRPSHDWYGKLASSCFSKWQTARDMLVLDLPLTTGSEALYRTAFWSLCELTPADSQLKLLFEKDRSKASRELVRHVDAYANQLALAADLARTMAAEDEEVGSSDNEERLAAVQESLLDRAGERLTLTEAAGMLGITRQALHKKIRSGAALGLMKGDTFVIPAVQLVYTGDRASVVAGLRDVLKHFDRAGNWSALQYLIEPDPSLGGKVPLDMLKSGETGIVVSAARSYLGLDEG